MCIYRINYINRINVTEAGIYSHMTTESPTELCWVEKYLLWLREALAHGRMRDETPLNEPSHKSKNWLHLTRDCEWQPQPPNKEKSPDVPSMGRPQGPAGLISDTCSPSWGAFLVVSSSKAEDSEHSPKKNQKCGQVGLVAWLAGSST